MPNVKREESPISVFVASDKNRLSFHIEKRNGYQTEAKPKENFITHSKVKI